MNIRFYRQKPQKISCTVKNMFPLHGSVFSLRTPQEMRDCIFEIVSMPACVFYRKFSLENTRYISSSVCIHTSNKFRLQSGPSLEARYVFLVMVILRRSRNFKRFCGLCLWARIVINQYLLLKSID